MGDVTKGLYYNASIALLESKTGKDSAAQLLDRLGLSRTYNDLSNYPIDGYTRLLRDMAPLCYPEMAREAALFEIGQENFLAFANSSAGKVAIALFSGRFELMVRNSPKLFRSANKFGTVMANKVGEKAFRVVFAGYRVPAEYHHGVISAGVDACEFDATVELTVESFDEDAAGRVWTDFTCTITGR